jgi:predicted PurR-regulated permease PerM
MNFAPYVGPAIAITILGVAGLVQFGVNVEALIPPAVYLMVNLIESQIVTPTVLGRHMRLNPLVLILWILLWGWLWGAIGVLLAVPLLVCIKLVVRQLGIGESWVTLIETQQ